MIDAPRLLADLRSLVRELEEDLRQRADGVPEVTARLREEHRAAAAAERTAESYPAWRDELLTQVAVAWVLGCVFVRFLEDNGLVPEPWISGPGERRQRALDAHELFFRRPEHRTDTDREYLLAVFEAAGELPAAREVFDREHNPLWRLGPSGDGATRLLRFWQRLDPETGEVTHDLTDPEWSTRFLGDLYQDLSESARKRYALLQTPEFVEAFLLDRTLTPALDVFGLPEVRVLDPTCGSGHFLLGAFHRLFELWLRREPGTNPRALAQRALDQVCGVDVNPFAVAIARFRLLVAALKVSEVRRLADAPGFHLSVACGDSLLHGRRFRDTRGVQQTLVAEEDPIRHVYETEDAEALRHLLGRQYAVVVGNPPYITVKDKALNQAYRDRYGSCHRQYSLAAPFIERFFDLTLPASGGREAGFTGMIVANSFMKREFGKKLVEEVLPRIDLTHVLDTSGAYIPGHGTPTVILLGRHRGPVSPTVRAVQGIRGEPATPRDPAHGRVWTAVVSQVDRPGSESEWVSTADVERVAYGRHPWSVGGGGASELKATIEEASTARLGELVTAIGRVTHTGCDEAYFGDSRTWWRRGIESAQQIVIVEGEAIREWTIEPRTVAVFPYDETLSASRKYPQDPVPKLLWLHKQFLVRRREPNGTHEEIGLTWYEWSRFQRERFLVPFGIPFAFVATHNHFVLDRGGKVFNRTAPIIKLPAEATEDDHLALLGLLNSSTACFWMKQVFYTRGEGGGSRVDAGYSPLGDEPWKSHYEFTATGLREFPLPARRPLATARRLDTLARRLTQLLPSSWGEATPSRLREGERLRAEAAAVRGEMISLQEELDWESYELWGLAEGLTAPAGTAPPLEVGERAFEIALARKLEAGELETAWFERHGSQPVTQPPAAWPTDYRALIERRLEALTTDRNLGLLEQPEHKRRWSTEPWETQLRAALYDWLAGRLEAPELWREPRLTTCARLADTLATDTDFMTVAEHYRGHADFDVTALVSELAESEAVPFLATLRYKPSGLAKHERWQRTWDLQRREDALDARTALPDDHPDHLSRADAERLKARHIGTVPVPPKYKSADYTSTTVWRHRGKLDVPKERFVSYPGCERAADPTLVIGWAGWDHLQQARALADFFLEMKEREGWAAERLIPLLAGLLELVPWVKQWHNDPDPEHGVRLGDYFESFAEEEARALGLTLEEIRAWVPPKKRGRGP